MIGSRYGDPLGAKAFWAGDNWYADGGLVVLGSETLDRSGLLTDVAVNQSGKPAGPRQSRHAGP
jgi:hypothetical protein